MLSLFSGFFPASRDVLLLLVAWAVVSLAIFFTRLWPLRGKSFFGIDLWTFLLYRDELKREWPPRDSQERERETEAVLIREGFDYPPLFALVLALLPDDGIEYRSRFVNPLIDSLHALLLMSAAYWLSGSVTAAVFAGAFVVFTAAALVDSWALTSRSLSALLYSMLAASLLLALREPLFYVVAAVVFAFVLLGHKMATQTAFFTLLALSIVFWNAVYVSVLIGGFVLALVLSRGFYWKILRGHLVILDFWLKSEKTLRRTPSGYWAWLAYGLAKISLNPWTLFALAFFALLPAAAWTPELSLFFAFLASSLALFVLTAFRQLSFLGENHRYLQYSFLASFVPAAVLIAEKGFISQAAAACAIAFCVAVSAFAWRKLAATEGIAMTRGLGECVAFLKRRKEKRLWCLNNVALGVARYSGKRVLVSRSIAATLLKYPFFVLPPGEKEFPKIARRVAREFGVQLVLARASQKSLLETPAARKLCVKIFDNGAYAVYKFIS